MKLDENLQMDRYQWAADLCRALFTQAEARLIYEVGAGDARMKSNIASEQAWVGFDREGWGEVEAWDLADPCPRQEERADIALLLDVIEHLPDPMRGLRNLVSSLNEGGHLILTTPNPRWSGNRVGTFLHGTASGFNEQDLVENYHLYPIWPHTLEELLHLAGLEVVRYVTLDGSTTLFWSPGTWHPLLRMPLNVVQMMMERADPTACGMSYGVLARKISKGSA